MSLSGSLWAETVLGEEHSETEGRLEESTPLKEMRSEKKEREGEPGVSYLSSVEQEMVLSFALSRPMLEAGLPPSSMLESIILTL